MTLITARSSKASANSKLGLAFSRKDAASPLTIGTIRDNGLFAEKGLEPGMVVVKIQGADMTWKSAKDAADVLSQAESDVEIVAAAFIGEIEKEDKTSKLGIALNAKQGGIFVTKINEGSVFEGSELAVGQKVLSINGVACPATAKEAIALLKEADGTLRIVAADYNITEPPPARKHKDCSTMTLITARSTKPTVESKLGLAFSRQAVASPLFIKSIRDDGLFAEKGLEAGMVVVKVQGADMTWKYPKDAADALCQAESDVEIVAAACIGEIEKEDTTSKLGIALVAKKGGIFVSKINDESVFAGSELDVGQKVLSINGVTCPETTKEASKMLKEAVGTLKIVTADHHIKELVGVEGPPKALSYVERVESETPEETPDEENVPPVSAREIQPSKTDELMDEEADKKGLLDSMLASCMC